MNWLFQTLILTFVLFSICPLRLHFDIFCGAGPVLVTTENTTMGHLHILHQPLRRPFGTRAYHLLLLFRPSTGHSGGPTRLELLSTAQIPPIPRSGGTDKCWRYRAHRPPVKEADGASTAILLTRVYALWDRNRVILWSLLVYYFGFAGFAAVRHSLSLGILFSICLLISGQSPKGNPKLTPLYRQIHWDASAFYRRMSAYKVMPISDQLIIPPRGFCV